MTEPKDELPVEPAVGDEVEAISQLRHVPIGTRGVVISIDQDKHYIYKLCVEWSCGTRMGLLWWKDEIKVVGRPG